MAKVLLVEDDNNLREIYEARLQAEGYDIVTAHDGEEALVVAKNETPDLIISDVMMPKISGFEMLDILRNTDGLKDVKIIMLTALGQSDDQQRADRLGANRYLVKSQVTLEDIVKVAQELLAEGEAPAAPALEPAVTAPAAVTEPMTVQSTAPEPADLPMPVAPEPVAAEPVLAVTPPPADVATPISQPIVADDAADAQPPIMDAQLTTTEESDVEAQIKDFVQGASTEATIPSATVTEPAPDVVAAPTFTPEQVINNASDDKLITDALDTFAENTASEAAPALAPSQAPVPGSNPAIVVASGLPTIEVPEIPGMPIDGIDEPANPDPNAQAIVARKKIIEPLNVAAKPDLNALLAREAANEAKPDTVIAPTVPAADPGQPATVDPNSIAL